MTGRLAVLRVCEWASSFDRGFAAEAERPSSLRLCAAAPLVLVRCMVVVTERWRYGAACLDRVS